MAQVALMLLQSPDAPRNADYLGIRLNNPRPPSRKAAAKAAVDAIIGLRATVPDLLYTAGGGRGWRINSNAHVTIVWCSPDLKISEPAPLAG